MRICALCFLIGSMVSSHPQGTLVFHNRGLTDPATGTTYNAPFLPFCESSSVQLFQVIGVGASATYTPLFPMQTFRPMPNNAFFKDPVIPKIMSRVPLGSVTGIGGRSRIRLSVHYMGHKC